MRVAGNLELAQDLTVKGDVIIDGELLYRGPSPTRKKIDSFVVLQTLLEGAGPIETNLGELMHVLADAVQELKERLDEK